jgi:hypothetical protein
MRTIAAVGLLLILSQLAPASADELNLPARKPGLWQMSMTIAGHPMATKQCVDAVTDRQMMQSSFARNADKCSSLTSSRSGSTITVDATCALNGGVVTRTHAVIAGDFQSEYTVDANTDISGGPAQMPKHSQIKQDVKWIGACPAGMKPGDMQMPGMPAGMPPINLKQLQMMKGMGG